MREEILINVTPREVRAALVENGMLQEIHIERASRRGLIGNIYKGRVSRVLPGMQAAFVDIGAEQAAFIYVSDVIGRDYSPMEDFLNNDTGAGEDNPYNTYLSSPRRDRP